MLHRLSNQTVIDDYVTGFSIQVLAVYQRLITKEIDEKYLFKYKAMAGMLGDAVEEKEVFFCTGGCGKNVQMVIFIAA